jgi:hypothetical protein
MQRTATEFPLVIPSEEVDKVTFFCFPRRAARSSIVALFITVLSLAHQSASPTSSSSPQS